MSPHAEQDSSTASNGVHKTLPVQTNSPPRMLSNGHYDEPYDLIGIGFGPANLALAVALHDIYEANGQRPPRLLFLERQDGFGWHRGMLLPNAKMQISFIKDLATLRNPRSHFTFLNYLHQKGRLASFTNLGTFLPQRTEYEDYMSWCASHFDDIVLYHQDVVKLEPTDGDTLHSFRVESRDTRTNAIQSFEAKKVVLAIGGAPLIPKLLQLESAKIIHSSKYLHLISKVLPDESASYKVAVIGGGQSAAEIFNDLHSRYPNSHTRLLLRGSALKPSDDSPLYAPALTLLTCSVNEIFDPDRVTGFFNESEEVRERAIRDARPTNYGVVRLPLLEHIYETLYMQKVADPEESHWQHQILNQRDVFAAQLKGDKVILTHRNMAQPELVSNHDKVMCDAVIIASGYQRDSVGSILKDVEHFRPHPDKKWTAQRDFSVELDSARVAKDCGIFLSGCNQQTHGLSDTLLSVLSVRGSELAEAMFKPAANAPAVTSG